MLAASAGRRQQRSNERRGGRASPPVFGLTVPTAGVFVHDLVVFAVGLLSPSARPRRRTLLY